MASAKSNPVVAEETLHSDEVAIMESPIDTSAAAQAGVDLDLEIEQMIDPRKLDMEKFMQDELLVRIDEPRDSLDAPLVYIGVNDAPMHLRWKQRGRPIKLKRFEVAVLAHSKTGRVYQEKATDSEGFDSYEERVRLSPTYSFIVLRDPSPYGRAWLRQELSRQA